MTTQVTNEDATTNGRPPRGRRVVTVRTIADFETLDVEYLEGFEGMIPMGMPSVIVGDAGLGKSTLNAFICASQARLGHTTCLLVAEDSIEHIVRPRLQAAGLNDDNQHLVKIIGLQVDDEDGQLRLPDDAAPLRDALDGLRDAGDLPTWINLDPVTQFLGRTIDNARDQDVRDALGPLGFVCKEFGCAVTLTAHLNKGHGTTVMERLANSAAFYQWPRSILLLARDPDDPEGERGDMRVLASEKLTVDRKPLAHSYRITAASVVAPRTRAGFRDSSYLARTGTSDATPSQLLAASRKPAEGGRPSPQTDAGGQLLRDVLADGPVEAGAVRVLAKAGGISGSSLDRARERVGVVVESNGGFPRTTTWRLP